MAFTFSENDKIGYITLDLKDAKVNVLTGEVIKELSDILDVIKGKGYLKAIVFQSGKKDVFIAGADIKEIESLTDPADAEAKSRAGQNVLNKIEDLPLPTVAVMDGVAFGGGCELALACTYRVATFNERLRIGLPEVNLGIFPGFGGTWRLPRLIGLTEALTMILAGKPIDGRKALKLGLVDRLFPQTGLEDSVRQFVERIKSSPKRISGFKPKKKGMKVLLDGTPLGQMLVLWQARQNLRKKAKGFYPAPLRALEVIAEARTMKRAPALALEAREFSRLAVTGTSKNLIHLFYLSEKFKKLKIPGTENLVIPPLKKCGVLGAGVMGGGIAQLLSDKNIVPRVKDLQYGAIASGLKSAAKIFKEAVKRRRMTKAESDVKMAMITGTTDYTGFHNVDAVIEAVVENLDVKKKVFAEVAGIVPEKALLFSNTSALSVTEMAKGVAHPERVAGFHFFNPVHRMPLVEIIRTDLASRETLVAALELAKKLGKTPVIVKDTPGFLVNRILLAYINEAGHLLEEGATIEFIDKVMTDFGMPMGPLLLADEVGLDVGVKVLHILNDGLGERFKPVGVFEAVAGKGLLGKKSGRGFYIHEKKGRAANPEIYSLLKRVGGKPQLSVRESRDRMVYVMINEAARCLEDGVIDGPDAVDIGMVMGTGFPPFLGGLLKYADDTGTFQVVETLKLFESKLNAPRFSPCPYLLERVKNKKQFYG